MTFDVYAYPGEANPTTVIADTNPRPGAASGVFVSQVAFFTLASLVCVSQVQFDVLARTPIITSITFTFMQRMQIASQRSRGMSFLQETRK